MFFWATHYGSWLNLLSDNVSDFAIEKLMQQGGESRKYETLIKELWNVFHYRSLLDAHGLIQAIHWGTAATKLVQPQHAAACRSVPQHAAAPFFWSCTWGF